jgi:hypothetical protein
MLRVFTAQSITTVGWLEWEEYRMDRKIITKYVTVRYT